MKIYKLFIILTLLAPFVVFGLEAVSIDLVDQNGVFMSADFSPKEEIIVTGSGIGDVKVWNLKNNTMLFRLASESQGNGNAQVKFNNDGKKIVAGFARGKVKVWNTESGAQLLDIDSGSKMVRGIMFSPDDTMIVAAFHDGEIKIWDASNGTQKHKLSGSSVPQLQFSPNGESLMARFNDASLKIWNMKTGALTLDLPAESSGVDAMFSPDGKQILTGYPYNTWMRRLVKVINAENGSTLFELGDEYNDQPVSQTSFNQSGSMIMVAFEDGSIKVWDVATRKLVYKIPAHGQRPNSAGFSPDGTMFMAAFNDGSVKLWNAQSGKLLRTLPGEKDNFGMFSKFSHDSKKLSVIFGNFLLRIWFFSGSID